MNVSQQNLYEIIDALGVRVNVGQGVFEINQRLEIENDKIYAQVDIEGVYMHETARSMWALMKIGDLGIVAKASNGDLVSFCFFDLSHEVPASYMQTKDYKALLTHMGNDNWKNDWIARVVKCS